MSATGRSGVAEMLGGLLRELRAEANLTQKQVADRLEVPQGTVSKMESGERGIEVAELVQLCAALGVSLSEFVRRLEEKITAGDHP